MNTQLARSAETKTCVKCGNPKLAADECKVCKAARAKAYREAHKEQESARKRAYYEANKDKVKERARNWRINNKERDDKNHRAYVEANREHVRTRKQMWREANKDHSNEYFRAYYAAHKDQHKAHCQAWTATNIEAARVKVRLRRARRRGAEGTHTAADIREQYKRQGGKCYYCHMKVGDTYHVDHVVPLSRGGSNGPENLVIACPTCNQRKQDKMPHEWAGGGRLL